MTILVTGGAGYIGTHTTAVLIEKGYDVVSCDNLSNSKAVAIERVREITETNYPFYEIDVCDSDMLDMIFEKHKIDQVIHFAGLKAVGESVEKPISYYENNLCSTISLCKSMARHSVRNVIFSSSATVYSGNNDMPVTEKSKVGDCLNPYGWTKLMCEQIFTDAVRANPGFSATLLRYFNPVGAHESGKIGEDPNGTPNNIMPYIAQTAVGKYPYVRIFGDDYDTPDGTGVRDYIHVTDLADGHVAALEFTSKNPGVHVFNLGTGRGVSVLELLSAFMDENGVKIEYKITDRRPGDLAVCYAATDKAKQELGWEARKTLAEMCKDTYRWQQMNPKGY